MRPTIAASLILLIASLPAVAEPPAPLALQAWVSIGMNTNFALDASGDVQSAAGANIVIRARHVDTRQFGGALSGADAQTLQGRQVVLSAHLSADTGTRGTSLWLRADDSNGRSLAFASSGDKPIVGGEEPALRQLSLRIPAAAQRIVFGVGMNGNGRAQAQQLRLDIQASTATDSSTPARSTTTPREVADAAIAIVRANALKSGTVDWDKASTSLLAAADRASTTAEIHAPIRQLLGMLGDGHSALISPDAAQEHSRTAKTASAAEVKSLGSGIGYVQMPAFVGREAQASLAFANAIATHIEHLAPQASVGWVLDLRSNGGGNMWPMLAALKPLLGSGIVGGARFADGKSIDWRAGDRIDDAAAAPRKDLSSARVAVLLGSRTASSGEAVAVAFHGRPQSRSFGQASAGRSSINSSYPLPDGSLLLLTTALDIDRNGVVFGGPLQPDEATAAADANADPALAAATAWLTRQHRQSGD